MPVTVVSRLALGRWISIAAVVAIAGGAFFWGASHPQSHPRYDSNGPVAQTGAIRVGGFIGGVICLFGLAYCIYLPVSGRGRAIWIQNDQLIFADGLSPKRVPLAMIADIRLGSTKEYASGFPMTFEMIELHCRDGRSQTIPTAMLAEEAETVLARLQDALKNYRSA
jgi:hypothetical protein